MAHEAMPDHRLKGLREWSNPARFHLRDHNHHIAMLGSMAAVATDDSEDARAARLRQIDGVHDVGTNVSLGITAADRVDEDCVPLAQLTDLEPSCEDSFPSLVVGTSRQLRHVIHRAIGLDAAQLAEIVHGVTAIGGAAADAEQKQPAFAATQLIELERQLFNGTK